MRHRTARVPFGQLAKDVWHLLLSVLVLLVILSIMTLVITAMLVIG